MVAACLQCRVHKHDALQFDPDEIEPACRVLLLSATETALVGREAARLARTASQFPELSGAWTSIKAGLILEVSRIRTRLRGPLVVAAFKSDG